MAVTKLSHGTSITPFSDLYKLKVSDLTKLDRVGEKSDQKALDNLFASMS